MENIDGGDITSLWKIRDTVRRLVIVTSYIVLVAMTIALLLRFTLFLVCRRLAMTSSRSSRRVDDAKASRFSHSKIAYVVGSCFCCRLTNDNGGNYDDGGDAEDDNDAAAGSPQRSLNSVGFMFCDQAPVDLRYIETKV